MRVNIQPINMLKKQRELIRKIGPLHHCGHIRIQIGKVPTLLIEKTQRGNKEVGTKFRSVGSHLNNGKNQGGNREVGTKSELNPIN